MKQCLCVNTAKNTGTLPNPSVQFFTAILLNLKYTALFWWFYGLLLLFVDLFLLMVFKTVRHGFGGLYAMKNFQSIDETPPTLELSSKTATNLKRVLPTDMEIEIVPLMETLSSAADIHVKSFTNHAGKTG